jgi:hypothetical protein
MRLRRGPGGSGRFRRSNRTSRRGDRSATSRAWVNVMMPAKPTSAVPSTLAEGSMTARSRIRSSSRGSRSAAAMDPPPKHASARATSLSVPPRISLTRTTVFTMTMAPAAAPDRLSASRPLSRGVAR